MISNIVKIYELVNNTDNIILIGMTKQQLSKCFYDIKVKYNIKPNCSCHRTSEYILKYGLKNVNIILIKEFESVSAEKNKQILYEESTNYNNLFNEIEVINKILSHDNIENKMMEHAKDMYSLKSHMDYVLELFRIFNCNVSLDYDINKYIYAIKTIESAENIIKKDSNGLFKQKLYQTIIKSIEICNFKISKKALEEYKNMYEQRRHINVSNAINEFKQSKKEQQKESVRSKIDIYEFKEFKLINEKH